MLEGVAYGMIHEEFTYVSVFKVPSLLPRVPVGLVAGPGPPSKRVFLNV